MMSLTGRRSTGAGVVERSRHLDAVCLLGVQAALNILYGIPKQTRTDKLLAFTSIIFSILMRF